MKKLNYELISKEIRCIGALVGDKYWMVKTGLNYSPVEVNKKIFNDKAFPLDSVIKQNIGTQQNGQKIVVDAEQTYTRYKENYDNLMNDIKSIVDLYNIINDIPEGVSYLTKVKKNIVKDPDTIAVWAEETYNAMKAYKDSLPKKGRKKAEPKLEVKEETQTQTEVNK
jgi:hypothetical protein